MTVGIIDSGICNLTSVGNAFAFLEIDHAVVASPASLDPCSHLVLPGVGAFFRGMENLEARGLDEAIPRQVEKGKPLLGVCLGMQLLAEEGEEFGPRAGLGLLAGRVVKLSPEPATLRLPHIGWNELSQGRASRLFQGIEESAAFYFLHSYGFAMDLAGGQVSATCDYGGKIVAAVEKENVFGVQFHPEKSQRAGLKLLENFAAIC